MKNFFISYQQADRSWAEWIGWQLEETGYTVVLQAWDFRPGSNFVLEMQRESRETERTIAVLSPDYLNKLYTQSEWAAAFAQDPTGSKGRLLPVRVRECDLSGLLSQIIYVDLVGLDEVRAREALLAGVGRDRAKPSSAPKFPTGASHTAVEQPLYPQEKAPINLFIMYAEEDQKLHDDLLVHLVTLQRRDIISHCFEHKISSTKQVTGRIDPRLNSASVVVPLISADFLASDYCYDIEVKHALELHDSGNASVIPVILRPVDWQESPFGRLQALPRGATPVTSWSDRDEAFASVAAGIRLACQQMQERHLPITPPKVRDSFLLSEVFKPSGVPSITFVEPDNFYLLKWALAQPGRGVVIEGPSGIGKTTALKKAIEHLQTMGQMREVNSLSARKSADLQRIINLPRWHDGVVVLDDFHRLEQPLREQLVDYLKYLADQESQDNKLIIVGIPGTGKKLVELAFDVALRVERFPLGRVKDEVILSMIGKGEDALNIVFDRKADIVRAVAGSLNIAQLLCAHLATRHGIDKTQEETKVVPCDLKAAIEQVMEQLSLKFGDVVRCFASLGGQNDRTCIELLQEISRSEDGFLSLSQIKDARSDLSDGINRFVDENYMDSLKLKCPSYENHLIYDADASALIVDDPQLTFYLMQTPVSRLMTNTGKILATSREQVFISYSHRDSKWLDRILVHLKPLVRNHAISVWDDTKIKPGAAWREEIKKSLASARVAILLVTADYLASDFIAENELPALLGEAEARGLTILTIIISPCLFRQTELERYQALNDPSKPLTMMNKNDQERILVKVAGAVEDALAS